MILAEGVLVDRERALGVDDTSRRKANQQRTSEDIAEEIKGLKDQIADLEQDHEKAVEREKAAKAQEERQEKLAALAQTRKDEAAAKAKRAEIEKDLKKGPKKKK